VRKVALDLVGHHLLDCLLDAMYDHFYNLFISASVVPESSTSLS
jgi:hypothetical protein